MTSTHDYKIDKRNKNIKIRINNKYFKRTDATISVFDSGFLLGDGVWTSLRLHNKKLLFINDHINRLFNDSKSIGIKIGFSKNEFINRIFNTIKINKMESDVHIRVIISRGLKLTPYQDPRFTIGKPTIVIIPEYKKPAMNLYKNGIKLVTVNIIRGPHNVQDPRLNTLSKLNCILACIEAQKKKGDEALMFDINGNISTNNSTHFFYIQKNTVYTSKGKYCVRGITRKNIIKLCKINDIKVLEKDFKLKDVIKSDEAFVTGSFAGVIPVRKINNKIFNMKKNYLTRRIIIKYNQLIENYK